MEKYKRVPRPKEPTVEGEIRITSVGRVQSYVTYAARLFTEQNREKLMIKATGNAIVRAVSLAEVLKRRFPNLHQLTKCGSTEITDEYEPLEEGLDKVTHSRIVAFMEITLAKEGAAGELDKEDPGYQSPIDQSLVKDYSPEDTMRGRGGRGRGRGRGRGGPRGRGRGGGGGGGEGGYQEEYNGGGYSGRGGGYRGGYRGRGGEGGYPPRGRGRGRGGPRGGGGGGGYYDDDYYGGGYGGYGGYGGGRGGYRGGRGGPAPYRGGYYDNGYGGPPRGRGRGRGGPRGRGRGGGAGYYD
uniref:DNA/RNA-binding protein Alba-like domain-containing protein n=1 Tax=Chromera velia CCMP2878 TaxID=1169474 RepID=A0A0G4FI14_9ALVE|eukprot:Cvel_17108.t1-p1 / transcript=Cvel_17108.t1 / gene=Cvel_17108 / organism=Chromera_velia_CCMP2878 / gene_product=Ribonuclease P protein subunit p25-like protein, putative / transcript_product=Ribonuclease P protein subunit p25-like protein, putative / location=Cvel_scaffold1349:4620-6409(-) / protein_length=296 / sequence_SO=supercontig / SO=protein_coding / is_pseudo=false